MITYKIRTIVRMLI